MKISSRGANLRSSQLPLRAAQDSQNTTWYVGAYIYHDYVAYVNRHRLVDLAVSFDIVFVHRNRIPDRESNNGRTSNLECTPTKGVCSLSLSCVLS